MRRYVMLTLAYVRDHKNELLMMEIYSRQSFVLRTQIVQSACGACVAHIPCFPSVVAGCR